MADLPAFLAHLTDEQRRAALTVGRSLLVSAAAGAGKTSVLAERCASLVCDVEPAHRCGADELLVVTFTEAAAQEMRGRIGAAIQKRLECQPRNEYLRQQLYQLDNASISTIHAFCRALIQRWFPQAGVDPQASVLAGDEAELLKREVLDALFVERYGLEGDAGSAFQVLVDEYGGGRDDPVAKVVLRVHRFISSLPDPQGWLAAAVDRVDPDSPAGLLANLDALQRDRLERAVSRQIEYGRELAGTIRRRWPIAQTRAEYIERYVEQLERWKASLAEGSPACWRQVADAIRTVDLGTSPRKPPRLDPQDALAYDMAKCLQDEVGKCLRVELERLCAFTPQEYREGLGRIGPHVRALVELVGEFDRRYSQAKRAQAAVDFDDLQRLAFRLLTVDGDATRPSEVARQVQKQYRYVLVDEFQDVDPLQAAILHCVCRESADPPEGNLFAVGDIKQSIYRFRLAEPDLFSEREDRLDRPNPIGEVIRLQKNFRSRSEVITAVNDIFGSLMRRSFGGTDYDDKTALQAAAVYPDQADGPMFGAPAVELHLIEPITAQTAPADRQDDGEDGESAEALPAEAEPTEDLEGIEREGFLIGQRIRQWMGLEAGARRMYVADRPRTPGGPPGSRPIEYRDVVILLRSLPYKAEPIAEVLRRMGIPVQIERDVGSIDSTEFRDLVSLLQVLDNRRQDIPLAAVLRSPLACVRFSESDLMRIRLVDRQVPFHEAVERYADGGEDADLRERVAQVLAWLDRYRERMRQEPVAQVLWAIYEETDYLAYVSGLPGGRVRRDHLLRLHELARQFGRFARQGLHRFLRFIDELVRSELQPQQPAGVGPAEKAVRIMTIHGSKGLEFPVVILADAHKRFNLEDLRGQVLVDRQFGIAMQAVDAERRIRYPTLATQLAVEHMRLDTLSEELRIWYVALTRAREHLMVVGRVGGQEIETGRARFAVAADENGRLTQLELESAGKPLDWLLPAVFMLPADKVWWADEPEARPACPLFEIHTYPRVVTDQWRIPPVADTSRSEMLEHLADLEPLPADEPVAGDEVIEPMLRALEYTYPGLELTTLPARVGVTELKRRWDVIQDPEQRPPRDRPAAMTLQPVFLEPAASPTAAERGVATHRFLQLVDLRRPCDGDDLHRQREDMVRQGRLTAEEADLVMLDGAAWFFGTDLGRRLRAESGNVEREVAFVSCVPPERLDPTTAARDEHDVVLLRGMVDVLLAGPQGLEIIDYKTDDVSADQCVQRADAYRSQMDSYAEAIGRIYRREVGGRHLVFLTARQVVASA